MADDVAKPAAMERTEMRLRRLEDALVLYARHARNCPYADLGADIAYAVTVGCRCGLRSVVEALLREGRG